MGLALSEEVGYRDPSGNWRLTQTQADQFLFEHAQTMMKNAKEMQTVLRGASESSGMPAEVYEKLKRDCEKLCADCEKLIDEGDRVTIVDSVPRNPVLDVPAWDVALLLCVQIGLVGGTALWHFMPTSIAGGKKGA